MLEHAGRLDPPLFSELLVYLEEQLPRLPGRLLWSGRGGTSPVPWVLWKACSKNRQRGVTQHVQPPAWSGPCRAGCPAGPGPAAAPAGAAQPSRDRFV